MVGVFASLRAVCSPSSSGPAGTATVTDSRIESGKSWVVSSNAPTSSRVNDWTSGQRFSRSGSSARTMAASTRSGRSNPSELGGGAASTRLAAPSPST